MANLKAKIIIEIMGRPPEHIKEALNTLVIKMGSEKGIKILDKNYHEPEKVEKTDNLWTSFAEVDLEIETLEHFFNMLIIYMPSHVEIYEPDKFKLDAPALNNLSNFVVSKLHKIDGLAKSAINERDILINKLEYLRKGGKMEDILPKEYLEKKDEEIKVEDKNKKGKAKKKK
jgi:hypothetical protein